MENYCANLIFMDRAEYLEKLEKEHQEIRRLFKELEPVMDACVVDDPEHVKNELERLKEALVEHVKDEDVLFYGELRRKAVELNQEALLPALDLFIEEMRKMTSRAEAFFKDYSTPEDIAERQADFSMKLKNLETEVLKRIESEERSLFYIYRAYFPD